MDNYDDRQNIARPSPSGLVVALVGTQVRRPSGLIYRFVVGDIHKQRLLKSLDLIGDTLQYADGIERFESGRGFRAAVR